MEKTWNNCVLNFCGNPVLVLLVNLCTNYFAGRRGSVVECLTPDQRVAGPSFTGDSVVSLSKTLYSRLSTSSTQEKYRYDRKIVDWDVKN